MKIRKINRGDGVMFLVRVRCPGCGYEATKETDYIPPVIGGTCSKCHTKFSITYNDGADEVRRAFELAEDYDETDLIIINEEESC